MNIEVETLSTLAQIIERIYPHKKYLIHIGGYSVLDKMSKASMIDFLERTGASAVSGYKKDTGWLDPSAPGLALEAIYFNGICEREIKLNHKSSTANKLRPFVEEIKKQFPKLGFDLRTQWD